MHQQRILQQFGLAQRIENLLVRQCYDGDHVGLEIDRAAPETEHVVGNVVLYAFEPFYCVQVYQKGDATTILNLAIGGCCPTTPERCPGIVMAQRCRYGSGQKKGCKTVEAAAIRIVRIVWLFVIFALVDLAVVVGVVPPFEGVGIDIVEQERLKVVGYLVVVLIDIWTAIQIGIESREYPIGIFDKAASGR